MNHKINYKNEVGYVLVIPHKFFSSSNTIKVLKVNLLFA